jgi:hypothetical protein
MPGTVDAMDGIPSWSESAIALYPVACHCAGIDCSDRWTGLLCTVRMALMRCPTPLRSPCPSQRDEPIISAMHACPKPSMQIPPEWPDTAAP